MTTLDLMTANEVAQATRISPSTLKDWRANRRRQDHGAEWGPEFSKLGRRVLYRRADVDAWLEARTR